MTVLTVSLSLFLSFLHLSPLPDRSLIFAPPFLVRRFLLHHATPTCTSAFYPVQRLYILVTECGVTNDQLKRVEQN